MRPMFIEPGEGAIAHRIYDMSIDDVKERKAKSLVFKSADDAGKFLGVASRGLAQRRKPGIYIHSKKHGKKFAIRIEKI